jgi:hypothetical protein
MERHWTPVGQGSLGVFMEDLLNDPFRVPYTA